MLIGVGKYASSGQQAGIINLLYDSMALEKDGGQRFAANTGCNHQPAYLVGSPRYFKDPNPYSGGMTGAGKDIGGVAASSITRDCLLGDNCAYFRDVLWYAAIWMSVCPSPIRKSRSKVVAMSTHNAQNCILSAQQGDFVACYPLQEFPKYHNKGW